MIYTSSKNKFSTNQRIQIAKSNIERASKNRGQKISEQQHIYMRIKDILLGKNTTKLVFFSLNHRKNYRQFMKIMDVIVYIVENNVDVKCQYQYEQCNIQEKNNISCLKLIIRDILSDSISNTISEIFSVVELMIELIIGDKKIPAEIKEMVLRLQFPILMKALVDKSFLDNQYHPATCAVKNIINLGRGHDKKYRTNINPTLAEINTMTVNATAVNWTWDEFYQRIIELTDTEN